MRKIITAFLLAIIFYFIYSYFFKGPQVNFPTTIPSPSPGVSENVKGVSFENNNFNYYYIQANPINLHLLSNLKEKLTAEDARVKNNCDYLVNAGFYTKDDKPIGLFIADFEKLSNATNSKLFNGFFTIDSKNNAQITFEAPQRLPKIALQSGPILINNAVAQNLAPTNDEMARRIVLEETTNGNLIFVAIFKKDNFANGPYLKDLPQVLSLINKDIDKNISSAINLDGGSHSAFITNDVSINEISTIGSYFCIR